MPTSLVPSSTVKLIPITQEDVIFTDDIEGHELPLQVTLRDQEWMNHEVTTHFQTVDQGHLFLTFEFFGLVVSTLKIKQLLEEDTIHWYYEYDSTLFEDFLRHYLQKQLEAFNPANPWSFDGHYLVLDFYNRVLKEGKCTRDPLIVTD